MDETVAKDYSKDKKDLISDFNEAKFQILRLHLLWQSCNNLSQSGKLTEWKWKLDAIWRELSSDAKSKDRYDTNTDWIAQGEKKKGTYIYAMAELNEKITKADGKEALYNTLQQKEMFLRCLQDEVGKGSKRKDKDEDDIDG